MSIDLASIFLRSGLRRALACFLCSVLEVAFCHCLPTCVRAYGGLPKCRASVGKRGQAWASVGKRGQACMGIGKGLPDESGVCGQVLPSTRDHLAKYARMDISLDTFPYAGTTTTVEALLMAVPVVTLRATGPEATHAQNVGVSLLTQVGCTELIANSEDEFVEIAVNLARSPERLRSLRETLRQRLLASPLCDGARYMAHVENQYRAMWRRFCEEEPDQGGENSSEAMCVKSRVGEAVGGDEARAGVERDGSREGGDMDEGGEDDRHMDREGGVGEMEREVAEGARRMDREGGAGGLGQVYTMDRECGAGEDGNGKGDTSVVGREQAVQQHSGDKEKEPCLRGTTVNESSASLTGGQERARDGGDAKAAHGRCNISVEERCREGEQEARSAMGQNTDTGAERSDGETDSRHELACQDVGVDMNRRAEGEGQSEEKSKEEHMERGESGMDATLGAMGSAGDARA